jgi:ATP-binding cassette subfamily F protein 2
LEKEARLNAEARACTGNFALHPKSRDIKVEMLSITFYGREILVDAKLELNTGRRYGLIGANGSGKSTLLAVVGNREVPIPDHIDIFLVDREMPATDKTALQCVMEVDEERVRLEHLAETLISCEDDGKYSILLNEFLIFV